MSLKRILGIALASRMGGRGRRRSSLGSAAMLGGLGYRRRPALGGKAGLAALGYMAYKEYRNYQARNPSPQGSAHSSPQGGANPSPQTGAAGASPTGGTSSGASTTGSPASGSGGIGGMVQDLINKVGAVASGQGSGSGSVASGEGAASATSPEPTEAELREDERAADNLSDDKALLLLRAMVTAAYADGSMSTEERQRIMSHIAEAGGDEEDRRVMEREIANPRSLDDLLAEVKDRETAEEVYLASSAAVDDEIEANRSYLDTLRQRLDLTTDEAREIDDLTA